MGRTVRSILGVVESLTQLFSGKEETEAAVEAPVVPKLDDLSMDDLSKERIRLEHEEKKLLRFVEEAEREKRATFEQATREPSARKRKVMARKIKELEVKAQNIDRNLRVVSQQLRIINAFVQVKENKRIWEQSGLWVQISQMDLSELESYVQDASVEGAFSAEKFGQIIGRLEGAEGLVEGVDEDPDVISILEEIDAAAMARESDPTAVEESYARLEERLRQKESGELDDLESY
ncbi:MAG: hypothetical protein JW900_07310 [Anaerolineae bacterium]|nr:hypothetical protein [Anaerolineae bacterium]